MAITDPAAIRFSNEQIRPMADRLARCFYRGQELSDAWGAIGGTNDEKMALLLPQITQVATLFSNTFRFIWWADRIWQSASIAPLIPNDAAQIIFDDGTGTAPDPSRPTITGQDARRLKNRSEEFENWLSRGTDADQHWLTDALATLPITHERFDDCARLSMEGAKVPTTAWGRQFAVDRCGEIVTQYEVTVPAALTQILKCAVNTGQ